jgi:amidase
MKSVPREFTMAHERSSLSRRTFLAKSARCSAGAAIAPALMSLAGSSRSAADNSLNEGPLHYASASTLAEMIRGKRISPVELMQLQIDRIRAVDAKIQAVEYLAEDEAMEAAETAKRRIAAGEVDWTKQPLFGVPISVKDNIEVAGMPTKCGAPGLRDYVSREDATVVRRLKDAGAIVVAKARLPFMAIWYESQNAFGCACNPYDLDRTAGGSSGGEGALVAAGAVPLGVGQDGNGSIRVPSHSCGIAGLAPALGRVSIAGLYPPAENWEKAFCHKFGPMARRVEDLALGLAVMAGEDPRDPFTHPFPLRNWRDVDPRTLRIAYWTHQEGVTAWSPTPETIETVENAAAALRERVDKIVKTEPPVDIQEHFQSTLAMYFDDGWQTVERLATRYGALDDNLVQQCIAIARQWRSEQTDEQVEHLKERWLHLRRQIRASLDGYDAVLTPVTCSPALPHGASYRPAMERLEYMHPAVYTPVYSLPTGVVRCGTSPEGLPIGVQVVGAPYREDVVLAVLKCLEDDFGGWRPAPEHNLTQGGL